MYGILFVTKFKKWILWSCLGNLVEYSIHVTNSKMSTLSTPCVSSVLNGSQWLDRSPSRSYVCVRSH